MMEISEMLQDHALLTGFVELLADTDTNVVKRTSRVAASIYYRALPQMMVRNLDEDVVQKAWPIVLKLTHGLMNLMKTSENEGVILCLVHFVQEAVAAHLSNDVSAYPVVAQAGRDVVKNGLRVLKELVSLVHVGGMVFITAMRSLVSLACLRPDLYEPVTSLVRKQVNNTPATLFDHNVRSLHKMLQRNLMKLLRISTDVQHKTSLIELMVVVGVPRRYMAPWAPPGVSMKRPLATDNDRQTPPMKQQRTQTIPTERVAPPPQKKPLSGFDLLTSLIPKSSFNMDEAETTIASRLNLKNVCDLIIANVERVPDDMPSDFAKKFLDQSVVGEMEPMKKRLSSLFAQVFTREQLKSLMDSKVPPKSSTPPKAATPPQARPVSPPKAKTPPLPPKDVDMRVFPSAKVHVPSQPLPVMGTRDYDARIDPAAISASRDPRKRLDTQFRDPRRRSPPYPNAEPTGDPRQQRSPPQNIEMSRDPRSAQKPTPVSTHVTRSSLLGDYKNHSQPFYSTGQWTVNNATTNGSILGPYNQILR